MEGFRRALTFSSGFEKEDIFFQLSQAQAQATSLLFRIRFHQLGTGTQHHLQFTLNGQIFATLNHVNEPTGILEYVLDGSMLNYSAGGNVIGLHRTGGSSSWIAMDALDLQTVPEPGHTMLAGLAGLCLFMKRRRHRMSTK